MSLGGALTEFRTCSRLRWTISTRPIWSSRLPPATPDPATSLSNRPDRPPALTAGATTVPHFVGAPVSVSASSFGAASGEFAVVSSNLTAPLGVVLTTTGALNTACTALTGSLTGKIALIARGACTFSAKIRNAQNAGASAVLVANNVQGDPVAMASDGTSAQPSVPAYMVSLSAGTTLKGSNGQSSTISATLNYFLTTSVDFQAGFSSQGPTDVDFRIKPDVMAPGVNVLSSIPVSFCGGNPCFAFFQGRRWRRRISRARRRSFGSSIRTGRRRKSARR